jgi:hypothetical protein
MVDETFTATAFGKQTGLHRNTVLNWIRSGKLRALKNASNQWEIPASEVDRIQRRIIQREAEFEEAKAAFQSLDERWMRGMVDRMTELLITAQRYRMEMWGWKQEEDPIKRQEIFHRVLKVSFPDLLDKAAKASRWHDFAEFGPEMFKDVMAHMAREKATP